MGKKKITEKYEVGLMVVSLVVIGVIVGGLTIFPEKGVAVANSIMYLLTHRFGSVMQLLAAGILVFLIVLALSKYGDIRLGNEKPQYSTLSWIGMMFFCGNGAGTVYWAFLEWGHHFNAAPQLNGSPISEAMNYEQSLTYCFYDWGPIAWAMLCLFVLPFAYHYHIKKDNELKFSALCKYAVGEKHVKGLFGKVIDFLFIFAAIGSIAITAGSAASTIAATIADILGISTSFALTVIVLLGVTVLYSLTSLLGVEKGMKRISDMNVYACFLILIFILVVGPTQQIIDSIVNSLGLLVNDFVRMTTWTDPIAQTGYPQDWTVFYLIYWFVFGPFTGLFVAKISKGRKIKEIIANMLLSGSAGLFCFFGIVGSYQQNLRIKGILDVPAMLANGEAESIALSTIKTLPLSKIIIFVYLFVIIMFLATTMDAVSFTLSSTVSKGLKENEEPGKGLKFVWCIVLCAIPIAIAYVGTDINTIKAVVLLSGFPLVVVAAIIYKGFLKEMFKDYKDKSREEIMLEGQIIENPQEK